MKGFQAAGKHTAIKRTTWLKLPADDLPPRPPRLPHVRTQKETLRNVDDASGGWTHSVQQVDLLLQLPDELVFVLVALQQPEVLLTLSGQLLRTRHIIVNNPVWVIRETQLRRLDHLNRHHNHETVKGSISWTNTRHPAWFGGGRRQEVAAEDVWITSLWTGLIPGKTSG